MLKQLKFFLFSSRLFHSIVLDEKNFQKRVLLEEKNNSHVSRNSPKASYRG